MPNLKKTVWTLNIDRYAPELCQMSYPLISGYARKIGADFRIINQRAFPGMPLTYEKLQIFDLGPDNDWNVYIDSDTLVFPDMFDITERLPKDTVAHYSHDHASNRWRGDKYFRRDGRDIGSCNWFAVASDWCIDLWNPIMIEGLEVTLKRILPTVKERMAGITAEHLIDDYILSRNIARFGLKFKTVQQIQKESNDPGVYFWHTHTTSLEVKLKEFTTGLKAMGILGFDEFKRCAGMTLDDWLSDYGVVYQARQAQPIPPEGTHMVEFDYENNKIKFTERI